MFKKSFLNQSLDPPIKNSWISPCLMQDYYSSLKAFTFLTTCKWWYLTTFHQSIFFPSKHVLYPSSHLICILFCPIISKRNVMNIVILAQIPHHIIMSSKQVLHVTMETPTSVRRIKTVLLLCQLTVIVAVHIA